MKFHICSKMVWHKNNVFFLVLLSTRSHRLRMVPKPRELCSMGAAKLVLRANALHFLSILFFSEKEKTGYDVLVAITFTKISQLTNKYQFHQPFDTDKCLLFRWELFFFVQEFPAKQSLHPDLLKIPKELRRIWHFFPRT